MQRLLIALLMVLAGASAVFAADAPLIHQVYVDKFPLYHHSIPAEEFEGENLAFWSVEIRIPPVWIRNFGFSQSFQANEGLLFHEKALRRTTFPSIFIDEKGKEYWAWTVLVRNSSLEGETIIRDINPEILRSGGEILLFSGKDMVNVKIANGAVREKDFSASSVEGRINLERLFRRFSRSDDSNGKVLSSDLPEDQYLRMLIETSNLRKFFESELTVGMEDFLTQGATLGIKLAFMMPFGMWKVLETAKPAGPIEISSALEEAGVNQTEINVIIAAY